MLLYHTIPNPNMAGAMHRYFEQGFDPGSFLRAVLSNDLREACGCADQANQRLIFEWVQWLYNEAPRNSWGSPEKVQTWIEAHVVTNKGEKM